MSDNLKEKVKCTIPIKVQWYDKYKEIINN